MLKSINPATGVEIAAHAELTPGDLDAKLSRAAATFAVWSQTRIAERTNILHKLGDLYLARKDELARMATSEMGKAYTSAISEIEKCASAFHYYARDGAAMLEPLRYTSLTGAAVELHWLSLGPILAVMPWNFPFWQVVRFLAPTILAGNVGLLKHASNVQSVAKLVEQVTLDAGAPAGLLQNLAIKSDAVAGVIADPRVAAVTLTGSEGAGRAVAEQAGRYLKKVVLELGGSDPFIVMPSANLDEAVRHAVKARIQNAGQSCICAKRMIVHAEIYDYFLEKFAAAMSAVKAGDPMQADTDIGPLSSRAQRDTVLGQIAEAEKLGAKLIVGGRALPGPGAFMSAGILTDVPLDSPISREEIFGPVAMVYRAADLGEAIRIANSVPFGLGSSVWTKDSAEQERFIREIKAGMTAINQMLASVPDAPFGGIKHSGHGRELGQYGLHEFMNLKTVYRK